MEIEEIEKIEENEQTEPVPEEIGEDGAYELSALREEIQALKAELESTKKTAEELLRVKQAEEINRKNASMSSGAVMQNGGGEYFTPDEVRAMSQKEIRASYSKIIESMKKWN